MNSWWLILIVILLAGCSAQKQAPQESISAQAPTPELIQEEKTMPLSITSTTFENNSDMPAKYTCQGADTSPPLTISGVPKNAESLVLVMDDPDAPDPAAPRMVWDHWVVFNIPPNTQEIAEGSAPEGMAGLNSWARHDYGGPCPPIGKHRYFFKLYALDTTLDLDANANKAAVMAAMKGHIIEQAELIGLYKKN